MKRLIANIFFSLFLNFFKGIKCDYNVSISHNVFLYLIKNNFKKLDLRNAILGSGISLIDVINFFNKPEVFGNVRIGRHTSINGPGTRICAGKNEVRIGAFCSIASNVVIQEYNHAMDRVTTYSIFSHIFDQKVEEIVSKGAIIIEDDVWIGSNAVVLSGVKIGRGSIVGAGSIVTKSIPPYSIVAGNPAKIIKRRFSDNTIQKLENSKWWEWDIEKIKANRDFFINSIN